MKFNPRWREKHDIYANGPVVRGRSRRRELSTRFGWRCWYCGIRLDVDGGHTDHIIPTSSGGPDISSNWALTCGFCNLAKQVHALDEFMNWLEWARSGKSFTPYNMDLEAVKIAIRDELGDSNWEPIPIPQELRLQK